MSSCHSIYTYFPGWREVCQRRDGDLTLSGRFYPLFFIRRLFRVLRVFLQAQDLTKWTFILLDLVFQLLANYCFYAKPLLEIDVNFWYNTGILI